jgi:cytidylate kinase
MVITISREDEAGAEEIAQLLCERGGLQLAERTVLERMAERERVPISQFAMFDDRMLGPIQQVLAEWQSSISHAIYLRRLIQALLMLEREDNLVIFGRGAAFVLTDPGTLHVRIIAPMPCRIARLVERTGCHRGQAQRMLETNDEARARFIRASFDADIASPHHYDLIVNTAELQSAEAVDIILAAARRKAVRRAHASAISYDLLTYVAGLRRRPHFPRVNEVTWRRCERRTPVK